MDENNIDNLFGERLKELRAKNGISQKQMAEDIGISPSVLSAYENPKPGNTKNPTILTAIKIAKYYGVSIDWLCGLVDEEQSSQIDKYSDIYTRLVDISKNTHTELNVFDSYNGEGPKALITFHDENIINFVNAWITARRLYADDSIDMSMYNDLIRVLSERYNGKEPIVYGPSFSYE